MKSERKEIGTGSQHQSNSQKKRIRYNKKNVMQSNKPDMNVYNN